MPICIFVGSAIRLIQQHGGVCDCTEVGIIVTRSQRRGQYRYVRTIQYQDGIGSLVDKDIVSKICRELQSVS